jgi:hypothetical protein
MTMEDLMALPTVVPLMTAATALGVGKNEAYRQAAAAASVEGCPVKRRGRRFVVTRPDLFRALGLDPAMVRKPETEAS